MGCISSKLKAEDVVGRCKARRKLMKQAVEHRHGFAAAHVAYLQALRNTGAALRQFAEGEGGLPASGHGPFARTPEPPPPPPMQPGLDALSDPTSPLAKVVTPALAIESPAPNDHRESLAAPKDWDFYEPFHPLEPPLHLQKQRKPMMQMTVTDSEGHAERGKNPSKADEKQSPAIAHQDGSQHSAAMTTEMQIEASTTDKKDGHSPRNDIQSAHVHEIEDDPTERATDECLPKLSEHGVFEHELGLMLRVNAKKDLSMIVRELDEEFLKAASGAASVTRELEACKPHVLHSTVVPKTKLRKYNTARVFSAFNWNWSRNPLSTMEGLNSNLNESGKNTSHALTLDRLLAWERKLFEEVKVVESLCMEREKKCLRLRRQEIKGEDAAEIEKTRVEIKRLHSLIMVSYHGVDSTIEAIEDLRDDELHPQLVRLIDELTSMWATMHRCHARQTQIIIHIKSLDAMISQEPTTEAHHQATVQLEKELHGWYESFCKLVATQRGYMAALHGWLKLSLMPIPTGKEKIRILAEDDEEREDLEIYRVCEEWHRALGCLPDKVASEVIKSLAEVVRAMVGKQAEEMKQKRKADKLEKQWEKKMLALRPWEEEEAEKRTNRGRRRGDEEYDTDFGEEEGRRGSRMIPAIGLLERREAVAAMKKKVEEEMMKHGRAVQDTRVLTMNNLQTGLPGVLEAMTGFATVCSQAFQHLHSLTRFPLH